MKFIVIYGSVRSDRQGIRAARFICRQLEARGHEAVLFDPAELQLPLLDKMHKEYPTGEAPAPLEEMAKSMRAADGFVVVSGEYNHSIPPALSNLMDHFRKEWLWRPSAIVTYSAGVFGGVRAAMQLRAFVGALGTPSISSTMPVPEIGKAFDQEGVAQDPAWQKRADRFLGELEWYAEAFARQRAEGVPY